jgi:excisionase family DNA binding protein
MQSSRIDRITTVDTLGGMTERITYSVQEVAQLLGISRGAAYEGVASGEIPSIRIGRRLLVPRASLNRLLYSDDASGLGPQS